jgi:hypothetical protein
VGSGEGHALQHAELKFLPVILNDFVYYGRLESHTVMSIHEIDSALNDLASFGQLACFAGKR